VVFGALSAVSPEIGVLYALRALTGFGISGCFQTYVERYHQFYYSFPFDIFTKFHKNTYSVLGELIVRSSYQIKVIVHD
jgi:hypothetical protein